MAKIAVANRLAEIRKTRGVSASELAAHVGITRQAIYAIQDASYVPNTEIALKLAAALGVSFDDLFSLGRRPDSRSGMVRAESLATRAPVKGTPMRVCRVGARTVMLPVSASPYYLPDADAVVSRTRRSRGHADLEVFADGSSSRSRLVLAGCDPATAVLSRLMEKMGAVEIVPVAASSTLALEWLRDGKVHIAGSHIQDRATGEFNLPFLRRHFPERNFHVVTFARWEEGLVIRPGNPKHIRAVEDLVRSDVRFVNRDRGSGSRALLDTLLKKAAVSSKKIRDYHRTAEGHLAAAYQVLSGNADTCLATRSAARTFSLDFIPLQDERYDFVVRKQSLQLTAIGSFFDVLQRATIRRRFSALAGYDTTEMGTAID